MGPTPFTQLIRKSTQTNINVCNRYACQPFTYVNDFKQMTHKHWMKVSMQTNVDRFQKKRAWRTKTAPPLCGYEELPRFLPA